MTLAIGIVAGDGIAIAADSRTSLQPKAGQYRVLSDYTHKVFKVANVAIATHGYAFLLGRNIAGHMSEFAQRFTPGSKPTARVVSDALADFFGGRFDQHIAAAKEAPIPPGATALGFLVGGYDAGVGCLYEVSLPSRSVTRVCDSRAGGAAWRGQTEVVSRLIKGIDLNLLAGFTNKSGHGNEVVTLKSDLDKMEYTVLWGLMNLQDAVDMATLLIKTTIDVQRLTHGSFGTGAESWPGVGGPIEVATVNAVRGFLWTKETAINADRPGGVAELV